MAVAVRTWLYSEWELAISGTQIDVWISTAYKGHATLSKEEERRTETQGPSPRACQQAKEVEEEQPEVGGNPERLNSSSGRGMGCAKCAYRSSVMRTKDDHELSIMDILKEKGWKMPVLERTLNIEGGRSGREVERTAENKEQKGSS